MRLIPLIIDCRTGYAGREGGADSLLALPLGLGSVLDGVIDRLAGLGRREILILAAGSDGPDYSACVHPDEGLTLRTIAPARLASALDNYETTDYLLILEARSWPLGGPGVAEVDKSLADYRGVTHVVSIGSDPERATERIECDRDGRIRRVRRLYSPGNWSEVADGAIVCSVAPARALCGLRFETLQELRHQLGIKGLLSRDLPVSCAVCDLTVEEAFLGLNEQTLIDALAQPPSRGFSARLPGVWVGSGCSVHPSVRLVPPVLIQARSRIEEGAAIIGPTLIGTGCRIGPRTVIAQSVLRAGTTVPRGMTVRQRVVAAHRPGPSDVCSPDATPWPSVQGHEWLHALDSGAGSFARPLDSAPHRSRMAGLAAKRIMDTAVAAVGLVLLSPLLVLAGVLIRLDSKGPVLFRHRREGKDGREFSCIKFRTMVQDAHSKQPDLYKNSEVDGPQFKLDRDPRVTRIGRWLRGTNVDELPQLLNVLAGQMSLVGPRPSPFRENQICVQWRRARLSVRPGITGLWQICRDADRSRGGFHEWIYYDLTYVRHLSFRLDLKIILATVVSLGGRWSVPLSWLVRPGRAAGGKQSFLRWSIRPGLAGGGSTRPRIASAS
ncbi:MAG: sugar transferase [Planctomycetes bacterium]|nr:sugar transferase [Planctomycetota bacterium]